MLRTHLSASLLGSAALLLATHAAAAPSAEPVAADVVRVTAPAGEGPVRFELQRSTNRGPWLSLGEVSPAAVFTDSDARPATIHQYRFVPRAEVQSETIRGGTEPREMKLPLAGRGTLRLITSDSGDHADYDHGVWIAPTLRDREGKPTALATVRPRSTRVGFENEYKDAYPVGNTTVPFAAGLWSHAASEHVYEVAAPFAEFASSYGVAGADGRGSVVFVARYEAAEPLATVLSVTTPGLVVSPGNVSYHVDPQAGSDDADGTSPDRAFKSLTRLGRVQLVTGDRVLLKGNATHTGRLVIRGGGEKDRPVLVDSYGDGVATIDASAFPAALVFDGATHVRVGKLAVKTTGEAPPHWSAVSVKLDDPAKFSGIDLGDLRVEAREGRTNLITLEPVEGNWDLSRHAWLDLSMSPVGGQDAVVHLRLENPTAGNLRDAVSDVVTLRSPRTVRLPIVVRPLDPGYQYFEPFFMYVRSMNVRDGTVDPRQIRRIVVATTSGNASLQSVATGGTGPTLPLQFFPFIDEFGQYIHGHWPGKIYSREDLQFRREEEARELAAEPGPADWNEFGGWKNGPQLQATGFFRTEKVDGKWWLVDPTGRLYFSYGPTGVGYGGDVTPVSEREFWWRSLPPRDGQTAQWWREGNGARFRYYQEKPWTGVLISEPTLVLKYGEGYERAIVDISHRRLRSWGFNTIANWSSDRVYAEKKTPYVVAIHFHNMDFSHHHDVFDPAFRTSLRERMERERGKTADDPWNIGYFVDNEANWGHEKDAIDLSRRTLRAGPKQWAKLELRSDLQKQHGTIEKLNAAWGTDYASWDEWLTRTDLPSFGDPEVLADLTAFAHKFARTYFEICRDEVKRVAPNNLYLGCRFHGHIDRNLMKIAAEYCDVVSYNIYDANPAGRLNQYVGVIDKPIVSGEWGFGSDLRQTPFGRGETEWDPQTRVRHLQTYMEQGLRHPLLVGAHFFQYRDQPISGRPDGEAILRGFVNGTDTPNDELVRANREVARRMYELRSSSK